MPGLSRRQARRVRCRLYRDDGVWFDVDDRVNPQTEWQMGVLRKTRIRYRVALPAVIALNKPAGVVTSRVGDAGAPTVFSLLGPLGVADQVEPVGRLDRETSGLLLFTGDGQLLHRLTHPKRAIRRVYRALVAGEPDPAEVERVLAEGAQLRDGEVARPKAMTRLGEADPAPTGAPQAWWEVVLHEGKYHEVRRLFGALGARVSALERTAYGSVELADLGLERGHAVRLPGSAVVALYGSVSMALPESSLEVEELGPGVPPVPDDD